MQRDSLGRFASVHGEFHPAIYNIWKSMKHRCYDKRCMAFARYGGRGIKICGTWLENYYAFCEWALSNGWEKGLQLDRIDNNDGYYPENCRFSTPREQANNRRTNINITYHGRTQTLKMWAREVGISYWTLHHRVGRLGWSFEKAINTPARAKRMLLQYLEAVNND